MFERTTRILLIGFLSGTCFLFGLTPSVSSVTVAASWQVSEATDSETDWRLERAKLEAQFAKELQAIVGWCRQNQLLQQVEPTQQLIQNRDRFRQYIFPPVTKKMPQPVAGKLGEWQSQVNDARRAHARRLFELARAAADANAGGVSYQLLHEVVYQDRDHQEARKMLGHVQQENRWRVSSDKLIPRIPAKEHDLFPIPKQDYITITTTHFQIDSTVGKERTVYLAEQLERWHGVWRQVFFEFWASPSYAKKLFSGRSVSIPRRRFRVIFFANKLQYLKYLKDRVRGIEESTGYYSDREKVSIFYDGGAQEVDTWQHELTHQMFRESKPSRNQPFTLGYFWVDEGVACYFESMRDFGTHFTLGGFEVRRVQYARLRRFLEGYYVSLGDLSKLNRENFQARADLRRMYSQSAGLADMFMNDHAGKHQSRFIEFLSIVYRGRPKAGSFEKILQDSMASFDDRYEKYLQVELSRIENHLESPQDQTELSVSRTKLSTKAFGAIGRCINLNWLDVSGSSITRERMNLLSECDRLDQLLMTECMIQLDALSGLAGLANLQEVDLSGSSVVDEQLKQLEGCEKLQTVKLIGTRVTETGLKHLAKMKQIKEIYLSRTSVSPAALARLRASRTDLSVVLY